MKEELKEVDNPIKRTYYVFSTTTGLYLSEPLCKEYNVGDSEKTKFIKNLLCYKITSDDLEDIKRKNESIDFKVETIFDLQIVLKFTVYVDKNHDNKLYVINTICEKYGIKPISKRIIEGSTYCNVTEGDIKMIEDMSSNEKVLLKKDCVEIGLNDEMKPAEYLFIYYYDLEDKKLYVQRNVLELARENDIEIEGRPKIIEGKNCYSITEEQINDLQAKTNYHGIEKIVKPKLLLKLVNEKLDVTTREQVVAYNHEVAQEQQKEEVKEEQISIPVYRTVNAFREPNRSVAMYQDIHSKKILANLYTVTRFNIDIRDKEKAVINGEYCYEITREDALFIINNANNKYSPYNVDYRQLPLGINKMKVITLYKDIASNKTFADRYVIDRFSLSLDTLTVIINNEPHYEIGYEDAIFIIEASNNNYSPYEIKIQELPLGLVKKEETAPVEPQQEKLDSPMVEMPVEEQVTNTEVSVETNNVEVPTPIDEVPFADEMNIDTPFDFNNQEVQPQENYGVEIPAPGLDIDTPFDFFNQETVTQEETVFPVEETVEEPVDNSFGVEIPAPGLDIDTPFDFFNQETVTPVEEETVFPVEETIEETVADTNFGVEIPAPGLDEVVAPIEETIPESVTSPVTFEEPIKEETVEVPVEENEEGTPRIIIYKDTTTGKLYIPEEDAFNKLTETKVLMNRNCYETTEAELERQYNKRFIITDVYPVQKRVLEVVICNNNGKLFVSKETLNTLNFYIENPHKIKVNKEIFEEITADDVDLIRSRESDELAINVIFKHITPTKKKGQ